MTGIICIYKEKGWTSFDVVAKARGIFSTKKIGHGGTLDPMAEGVLPLFVGNAAKAADFCPNEGKEYKAGFKLGLTTDTEDVTGKILSQSDKMIDKKTLLDAAAGFKGEIMQTPPMYSAVKVNGQRLYALARQGIEVERKPRPVTIYELSIDEYENNEGVMTVSCSKGTYIRALISDIGKKTGAGAVMTSLVRTRSGIFTLSDCRRLSQLEGKTAEELERLLIPVGKLYEALPKAKLDEVQTRMFLSGVVLDPNRISLDRLYDGNYYIESAQGAFLGVGRTEGDSLKVLRRFITTEAK